MRVDHAILLRSLQIELNCHSLVMCKMLKISYHEYMSIRGRRRFLRPKTAKIVLDILTYNPSISIHV